MDILPAGYKGIAGLSAQPNNDASMQDDLELDHWSEKTSRS